MYKLYFPLGFDLLVTNARTGQDWTTVVHNTADVFANNKSHICIVLEI